MLIACVNCDHTGFVYDDVMVGYLNKSYIRIDFLLDGKRKDEPKINENKKKDR